MKILPEHYNHIKSELMSIPLTSVQEHFSKLSNDVRVKDINVRLRWDCFHAKSLSRWACDNVYQYANDDHLDTALRKIAKELNFPKV